MLLTMELRKQENNNIERRAYCNGVEVRKAENSTTLRGYAAKFGSTYDMGWFTEEVHRDAFNGADMADVRVLLNHDSNLVLGRTKAGTARVGVDENGLWYEVDLPNSPVGENMRVAAERGDIDQSSWGFTLRSGGDMWEKRDGKDHRTLTGVNIVFDASPVTFPANPDTTVAKRSLEGLEDFDLPSDIADKIPALKEIFDQAKTDIREILKTSGEEQSLPPETTNDTGNLERRLRLILIQNKTQNKH